MARFFVFGDVHGNRPALERLLRKHGVIDELGRRVDRSYRVVSVGDLMNVVWESVEEDHETLDLALDVVDDLIVGNHEAPLLGRPFPSFSGFHADARLVERYAALARSGRVVPCVDADGVLVTHAGVPELVGAMFASAEVAAAAIRRSWDVTLSGGSRALVCAIGRCRGGLDRSGGILWRDDVHESIHVAFPQVYGHTIMHDGPIVRLAGDVVHVNLDRGCKSGDTLPGACWIDDGHVTVLPADWTAAP